MIGRFQIKCSVYEFSSFFIVRTDRNSSASHALPLVYVLDNLAGDIDHLVRWIILQEILNLVSDLGGGLAGLCSRFP